MIQQIKLPVRLTLDARNYPKTMLSLSEDKTDAEIIAELRQQVSDLQSRLAYYTQSEEDNSSDSEDTSYQAEDDNRLIQLKEDIESEVSSLSWADITSKFGDERNWKLLTGLEAKYYARALLERCRRDKVSTNPVWSQFI